MKRKLLFTGGVLIIILSELLILGGYCNRAYAYDNISIMYTDDHQSTYSIYNTYKKSVKNIFF